MFNRLASTLTDKAIRPTIEAVSYYITRMLQPLVMDIANMVNETAAESNNGQVRTVNGSFYIGSGLPKASLGKTGDFYFQNGNGAGYIFFRDGSPSHWRQIL